MKKVLVKLLCVMLITLLFPNNVHASNVSIPILPNFDNISEKKLDDYNTTEVNTEEEAYIFIKHRMLHRRPIINLILSDDLTKEVNNKFGYLGDAGSYWAEKLIDRVLEHTGIAKEGDYLRRAYNYPSIFSNIVDNKIIVKLTFRFHETELEELEVDKRIRELLAYDPKLSRINNINTTDFDKIKAVFNWIAENIKYDYDRVPRRSAYAGLFLGKTVCEGFSALFYRFCLELGIDSRIITGTYNGEQHAWNIVKLGDLYYNIDVTASVGAKDDTYSSEFLRGDNSDNPFNEFRIREYKYRKSEFTQKYPMSTKDYNFYMDDVKYSYNLGKLKYNNYIHSINGETQSNSGKIGMNVSWVYNNGNLTITGTGDMYDYPSAEQVPWNKYLDKIKLVRVEGTFTHIGNNIFNNIPDNKFVDNKKPEKTNNINLSSIYKPIVVDYLALDKDDIVPTADKLILNKFDDGYNGMKLPQGTKISWLNIPNTSVAGKTNAMLEIEYTDKTKTILELNNVYIRETKYNGKAVKIIISQEPYRTRYIKNKETFDGTGTEIRLVDLNGNSKNISYDKFEEYGVKFYNDEYCTEELNDKTYVNKYIIWLKYENFVERIMLTVEEDGNYLKPKAVEKVEVEQGTQVTADKFIENTNRLPKATKYSFVKAKNSDENITIDTNSIGEKTVYVKVEYPNSTKDWIESKLSVVKAKEETADKKFIKEYAEILAKEAKDIKISDETKVVEALNAYEKLGQSEKETLKSQKSKLDELKNKIEKLKIEKTINDKVEAYKMKYATLLSKDAVNIEDKTIIEEAINAYNTLEMEVKSKLTSKKSKLDRLKLELDKLLAQKAEEDRVEKIASDYKTKYVTLLSKVTVTIEDKTEIDNAIREYSQLEVKVQAKLSEEKAKLYNFQIEVNKLLDEKTKLEEENRKVEEYKKLYKDLLSKETVNISDKDEVEKALNAYEVLAKGVQEKLSREKAKLDKLKSDILEIEKRNEEIEKRNRELDKKAEEFRSKYSSLLSKDNIELSDENLLNEAIREYEKLEEEVAQSLVGIKEKLDVLRAKYLELEKDKEPIKIGWIKEDGIWRYYDSDGKLVKGWLLQAGKWYYLRDNGDMATGWILYKNKWYYLNDNGDMATGWILYKNKWYYLNDNGDMATGWILYKNKWYYLNDNGDMATGWILYKNKWYYLNDNGDMTTGWIWYKNKWYYLNDNGDMATGWIWYINKWYYLNSNGDMAIGWLKDGNKWYYLNSSGAMLTGWQKINSKWYYFNSSGSLR